MVGGAHEDLLPPNFGPGSFRVPRVPSFKMNFLDFFLLSEVCYGPGSVITTIRAGIYVTPFICRGCHDTYHKLCGLGSRHSSADSSGGWTSKVKVWAGSVLSTAVRESVDPAPLLGLERAVSPCVSSRHLLPTCVAVSKCPFYINTPAILD